MNGTVVANQILDQTAYRAAKFERAHHRKPCLATVLVGDDPASYTYVRMKANRCRTTGLDSQRHHLPQSVSTAQAVDLVAELAGNPAVDGILVQHPMPAQIDEAQVFEAITAAKDVDGVTRASFAAMALGGKGFQSCTPGGIMRLLDAYNVEPVGQRAVVIGRSSILGKPVGMMLLARDATVTYCHSKTRNLSAIVGEADIVVAAVGQPELVKGDWIKPGAVVIDAGYNPGNLGDVEYATAVQRARLITPVPGGVGPTTIAMLLAQTVDAAEQNAQQASPPLLTSSLSTPEGLGVRSLDGDDVEEMVARFTALGWDKPKALFQRYLDEQRAGLRAVRVATLGGQVAGYLTVVWHSDYQPFRQAGIPEIVDLNVYPDFRRRGVARALLAAAEHLAYADSGSTIGIGVGLGAEYGAAQRLYTSSGYLPDGCGVMYDSMPVNHGASVPIDDSATLMLTKPINPTRPGRDDEPQGSNNT
jgi:methylenetetrahydrofolate dehydrogenase (NADP+)/methenyltetrahydrofolate cyclohydrolase